MRTLSVLFWLSSSAFTGSAYAADCENAYSTDQLLTDLIEAEELLKTEDKAAIMAKSKGMESGLNCMIETLPPILIGRVYRAIAGGLFYAGDEARGGAWFRTAVEVDPSYIYGIEDIGANHPIRLMYDKIRMEAPSDAVPVGGQMLREGPRHLLDGKRLREAKARLDRPHLYQLDEDGIRSWVIEGNAIPADALTGAAMADAGESKDASKPEKQKTPKAKKAPKEKVAKAPKEKVAKAPKEKVAKAPKEKAAKAPKEEVAKAPKEEVAKASKQKTPSEPLAADSAVQEPIAKVLEPQVVKEKAERVPKEKVSKAPKEKVAKAPKEPVVKVPKPAKVKPTKTKVAPVGLTTTVIGRDRPPEQVPLIVTGALAIVGSGVLYGLAVSNQNTFDDLASWKVSGSSPVNETPTDRQTLLRKQQAANRLFLGSFAVAAAGISTLTYGVIIDARTGRIMPTFNVRF